MEDAIHVKLDALGRGKILGKTKFKWKHLIGKVTEARRKALKIAGMEVRRGVQRSMSNQSPKSPKLIDLGTVNGQRLVVKRTQFAKPDRVTSWKTTRFPKGFLRSDIQYDFDFVSDTVVVGPAKLPKLNRLHEVGGTINLWFVKTRPPERIPRKFSGGTVFGITSNRPDGKDPIALGSRRVRARGYMAKGLKAAMPKIPEAFRDRIAGP